ncbi:uncharacterized protein CMC5_020260 [Chondromyces crocatus]|uniref:Uncharacterized protein n=1 Tax=Chondromyces crocatus TaxID=52 RepID=A0A0K1EBC5_CHOCO|nr:uncharacterized protein CMC5_020260 [Chondromyces crocatus]
MSDETGREPADTPEAHGVLRSDGEDAVRGYAEGSIAPRPLAPTLEMERVRIVEGALLIDPSPCVCPPPDARKPTGPRNPDQKHLPQTPELGVALPERLPLTKKQPLVIDGDVLREWHDAWEEQKAGEHRPQDGPSSPLASSPRACTSDPRTSDRTLTPDAQTPTSGAPSPLASTTEEPRSRRRRRRFGVLLLLGGALSLAAIAFWGRAQRPTSTPLSENPGEEGGPGEEEGPGGEPRSPANGSERRAPRDPLLASSSPARGPSPRDVSPATTLLELPVAPSTATPSPSGSLAARPFSASPNIARSSALSPSRVPAQSPSASSPTVAGAASVPSPSPTPPHVPTSRGVIPSAPATSGPRAPQTLDSYDRPNYD